MVNDGCKYFNFCEKCPMNKCEAEYSSVSVFRRDLRNIIIKLLRDYGLSIWTIAYYMELDDETVRRIVNK